MNNCRKAVLEGPEDFMTALFVENEYQVSNYVINLYLIR